MIYGFVIYVTYLDTEYKVTLFFSNDNVFGFLFYIYSTFIVAFATIA